MRRDVVYTGPTPLPVFGATMASEREQPSEADVQHLRMTLGFMAALLIDREATDTEAAQEYLDRALPSLDALAARLSGLQDTERALANAETLLASANADVERFKAWGEGLQDTLAAVNDNALAWHAGEEGKARALNVIAVWTSEALAGRVHPDVSKLRDAALALNADGEAR